MQVLAVTKCRCLKLKKLYYQFIWWDNNALLIIFLKIIFKQHSFEGTSGYKNFQKNFDVFMQNQ